MSPKDSAMSHRQQVPDVPPELAGKWVAWDRHQTRIVGSGPTFGAAKQAAAEAGEREVLIAKILPRSQSRAGHYALTVCAVFIAQVAQGLPDLNF
jgi:hypothetical protein